MRIEVEHMIAGVKRCRIVKDVLRLTQTGVSDLEMEIACVLHNLRVTCRHPLSIVDLLSWANSKSKTTRRAGGLMKVPGGDHACSAMASIPSRTALTKPVKEADDAHDYRT